jgi:hypothetical protein
VPPDRDQALGDGSYYPNATFENAVDRQGVADRLLKAHGKGVPNGKSSRAET